jgi:hypothetical protein
LLGALQSMCSSSRLFDGFAYRHALYLLQRPRCSLRFLGVLPFSKLLCLTM